jgi:hypothetical protein
MEFPHIKYHENPSSVSRAGTCRQINDMKKVTTAFRYLREHACKRSTYLLNCMLFPFITSIYNIWAFILVIFCAREVRQT